MALVRVSGSCKRTADVLWLLGSLAILEEQIEDAGRYLGGTFLISKLPWETAYLTSPAGAVDLGMILDLDWPLCRG